ncbi:MAG: polyphosphate kinase 2 family protein [Acidobacteriota bacterium]
MFKHLTLSPGVNVKLKDFDPGDTHGWEEADAKRELEELREKMEKLQDVFYASGKYALLIVLQAMDAGGKDGTVKHVMGGFNPSGCSVISFKAPSPEELSHDFLWRVHKAVPPRGHIGIFNRSHYEDVLVVRVLNLVPEKVWRERYDQINTFEKMLCENNVIVLKFFLHISKKEQADRFRDRLADPKKIWKFNPGDLEMREKWGDFMEAYDDVLERCTTAHAPWTIVPADVKWFRNLVVARRIVETVDALDLKYPPPAPGVEKIEIV